MKNRNRRCFHGCPEEKERRCFAYKENGRLCLQPATVYDPQRGCLVCERHAAQLLLELNKELAAENQAP
jgi:hypothetical protein